MKEKEIIKELNVEKLNIVEPDGTIKMTLFNSKNIPSLIIEGEDILPGHRKNDGVSGAMFYNNEGDECGGFIYGSSIDDNGKVSMGMSLTFDKYKQDQVMQLLIQKEGEIEQYGISIFDRPSTSIRNTLETMKKFQAETDKEIKAALVEKLKKDNAKRLFIGNDIDGTTKIALYDKQGKEAIKIYIDDLDNPQLEILGEKISLSTLLEKIK